MSIMRTIKRTMLRASGLPKRMVKRISSETRLVVVVKKPPKGKKVVKVKSKRRKMGVRHGIR